MWAFWTEIIGEYAGDYGNKFEHTLVEVTNYVAVKVLS